MDDFSRALKFAQDSKTLSPLPQAPGMIGPGARGHSESSAKVVFPPPTPEPQMRSQSLPCEPTTSVSSGEVFHGERSWSTAVSRLKTRASAVHAAISTKMESIEDNLSLQMDKVAVSTEAAWKGAKAAPQKLKNKFEGSHKTVVFQQQQLGITIGRDKNHRPVVCVVTEESEAASQGVTFGDILQSVRFDSNELQIKSYDDLFFNLLPRAPRPLAITFVSPYRPRAHGGVVNFHLIDEVTKATRIVTRLFADADSVIPLSIIMQARGLAVVRILKVGAFVSIRGGTGIVLARVGSSATRDWSAPCAVSVGGIGVGFQAGAEVTDVLLVLNTPGAVGAFASGSQVSLGGNIGVAVGPIGRDASLSGNIHGGGLASAGSISQGKVDVAPVYSYSHSKGLFAGVSLEGAVISPRADVNARFYGEKTTPAAILAGDVPIPAAATSEMGALTFSLSGAKGKWPGKCITNGSSDLALDHHRHEPVASIGMAAADEPGDGAGGEAENEGASGAADLREV